MRGCGSACSRFSAASTGSKRRSLRSERAYALPVIAGPTVSVEGTALVEGFRGDVLAYVRIGPDLCIERCHLRDPSWFLWPLLEAAIEGNIVADFPLCNKRSTARIPATICSPAHNL